MKIALVAATAALAAAPALAENRIDLIRPDAPELAPYGPHTVGVRQMSFAREDVIDVVNATEDSVPTYDRELPVEVWYPAAEGTAPGGEYTAFLRDGETEVTLAGRAARDAAPAAEGNFPLVVLSHGYPGNRFLMSHLGENLASKGYVVASVDHPDSIYSDLGAFGSTLVNRPQDQAFIVDEMAALGGDLGAIIDGDTVGVVGYSMGGYGALIFGGAGVTQTALDSGYAPPGGLLDANAAGSESHEALPDDRVEAIVAIGPWGRNRDFWDAEGLSNIDTPLMIVAGGVDDVSGYDAIRRIFEETTGTKRHLLTYANANHNAAAPMPAPAEAWEPVDSLPFVPFEHYADAVWDTTRMNNILQHFVTAFLDLHLKGESGKAAYLDLVEQSSDGVWSVSDDGTEQEDHTYWTGFPNRTAVGLSFETREAE
ncbi:alpha/beta hydrolase family protein [Tranquillimonas alkanivorans]|uniref:Predicted dienelactone hydrolase n=1 Tax=Tranquillimonas alkanivorans TaxID=441119 RepID=A0A1I5L3W4_9RHOB|nr:dienelactone hydrolase [Tranquillimonas alkanivorans]SFO92020.1 Predicted dienelactone hydrolase [Tranquillimonas alkanivorans]